MSLEGIREAYASIYNNQEQEVLDENVINYLKENLKRETQQIGGFIGRAMKCWIFRNFWGRFRC